MATSEATGDHPDPLVSGREAAAILAQMGVTREPARRALLAGVAGTGQRVRGSVLYERARVHALLSAPLVGDTLPTLMTRGTFIARIKDCGAIAERECDDHLLRQVARGWHVSPITRLSFSVRVARDEWMPFVATVSGFAVLGAEIIGVGLERDGTRFTLRAAGAWYESVHRRRVPTRAGGPWTVLPKGALHTRFSRRPSHDQW
ncbi:MAG: hypothetical protein L0H93_06015 [Nocardioides sp.]|nr:hypothetical protein [Nocardioides sp.]